MNGTESIEEHWLLKEAKIRRDYKVKLIVSLVISNLIVYLISLPEKPVMTKNQTGWFEVQKNHKKIVLKSEILIDPSKITSPKKITLLNQNNKILIPKAWFHSVVKNKNEYIDSNFARIEISDKDLSNLMALKTSTIKIVPFFSTPIEGRKTSGHSYEFIF